MISKIDDKKIRKFMSLCRIIVNSKIKKLPIWIRNNEYDEFMNRAYYGVYKAYKSKDDTYSKKQFANFVSAKVSGVLTDYVTELFRKKNTYYSFTDAESLMDDENCDAMDLLSYDDYIRRSPNKSTLVLHMAVDSALEALKSRNGEITRKYFVDGLSAQEIADEYDLHITRIFQILSETVDYLKTIVG